MRLSGGPRQSNSVDGWGHPATRPVAIDAARGEVRQDVHVDLGHIEKFLQPAAGETTTTDLDHFPALIIYRCLAAPSARQALVDAARASIQLAAPGTAEVVAMPRRTFGARPVEVLSPVSRTVLSALVSALDPALAEATRVRGAWRAHRDFGRSGTHSHVVELDFASCYELIDHEDLRRELLIRSFDLNTVDALMALLRGLGHRGRGLPQMLGSSDRLADTYLSVLDRRLLRAGYSLNRFADDIRVLASNWEEANDVIELAAEGGRSLALVLSASKTSVWLTQNLDDHEAAAAQVVEGYVAQVTDTVGPGVAVDGGPYSERVEPLPPETAVAIQQAYWQLLHDWRKNFDSRRKSAVRETRNLDGHIASALTALIEHPENLSLELLDDLVFDDATRFEPVSKYVLARHRSRSKPEARRALGRLAATRRQGPWAKLWILHLTEEFGSGTRAIPKQVREWLPQQLEDAHEIVRAQAAWVLATRGGLLDSHLKKIYPRATDVSSAALAAAAARQNRVATSSGSLDKGLVGAIRDDGRLNMEAHKWGA